MMHPRSGGSTTLSVTDDCRDPGGDGNTMPQRNTSWMFKTDHSRKFNELKAPEAKPVNLN
jgi:hypothetical protein